MDDGLDRTLAQGGLQSGARSSIPGRWPVPTEITLDEEEGLLCWRMDSETLRWVEPTPGLLHHFLRLRQTRGNGRDVLRFAQMWGPLHLCTAHQLPFIHQHLKIDDLALETKLGSCRPR